MADQSFAALRAAGFHGEAIEASEADFVAGAAKLGAGVRELRAVMSVESNGSGFYPDGRLKLLFEPHVFFRNVSGAKLSQAVAAGLAYPKWGTRPYPKDSYPRLIQAMALDETAALMAASWGLTQILGEGFVDAGYESPQAMVAAFASSEGEQLKGTASLMAAKGLGKALRARDWPAVARGWNGPQYKKGAYDTKLALAYARGSSSKVAAKVGSVGSKKAAALPAVAPLTFGQIVAGFFARLAAQKAA